LKSSQPGSPQTVRRLNHILAEASLVFAGSPELEAYAMSFNRGHVHLVPTSLERAEHLADISINGRNNKVVVGWIGNSANLHYLELIDEATWQVQQKYPDVVFSLMSGKPAEHLKTSWTFTPWSAGTEQAWLRSIDIGIMPLADDAWSRGKCAFKLLQYMACAKPVIASPVGANVTTVSDGRNGYLPATTDSWIDAFETLVPDSTARAAMGKESLNIFTRSFERSGVQGSIAELLKAGLR
jgi:glycosyltransferase involved in cell wall biosynthesis